MYDKVCRRTRRSKNVVPLYVKTFYPSQGHWESVGTLAGNVTLLLDCRRFKHYVFEANSVKKTTVKDLFEVKN